MQLNPIRSSSLLLHFIALSSSVLLLLLLSFTTTVGVSAATSKLRRVAFGFDSHPTNNPKFNEGFHQITTDATGHQIFALTCRHDPSMLIKFHGYPNLPQASVANAIVHERQYAQTLSYHKFSQTVLVATYTTPVTSILRFDAQTLKLKARVDLGRISTNDNEYIVGKTAFAFVSNAQEYFLYLGCAGDVGKVIRVKIEKIVTPNTDVNPNIIHDGVLEEKNLDFEVLEFPSSSLSSSTSTSIGGIAIDPKQEYLYAGTQGTAPAKIGRFSLIRKEMQVLPEDEHPLWLGSGAPPAQDQQQQQRDHDLDEIEASIVQSSSMLIDPHSDGRILFVLTQPATLSNKNNKYSRNNYAKLTYKRSYRGDSNNFIAVRLIKILTQPTMRRVEHLSMNPGEYVARAVVAMNTFPIENSNKIIASSISKKELDTKGTTFLHVVLHGRERARVVGVDHVFSTILEDEYPSTSSSESNHQQQTEHDQNSQQQQKQQKQIVKTLFRNTRDFPTVLIDGEMHPVDAVVPPENPNILFIGMRTRPGRIVKLQYVSGRELVNNDYPEWKEDDEEVFFETVMTVEIVDRGNQTIVELVVLVVVLIYGIRRCWMKRGDVVGFVKYNLLRMKKPPVVYNNNTSNDGDGRMMMNEHVEDVNNNNNKAE